MTGPDRIEQHELRCDACSIDVPQTRYDIPPGTRLFTAVPVADPGAGTALVSAGQLGLCELCRKIVESSSLPSVAARRLRARVFEVNPLLRDNPWRVPGSRKQAQGALERLWARLIPLLANPRPLVLGEHPLDLKTAWFDPPGPATGEPSRN